MLRTNEFFDTIDPENQLNLNVEACKYYTIDQFNSSFDSDAGNYLILNQNLQSFNAKKTAFEGFLDSLSVQFHTIVLTETWNELKYLNLCKIDNFDAEHTFRNSAQRSSGGIGGGISIFANSSLYYIKKIDELSICNSTIETCVTKISNKSNIEIVHFIVGVYRPHTDNVENFIVALQEILSNDLLQNKTIILAGDMNINLMNHNTNYVNHYISMLNSLNFVQAINKPTRFPDGSNSIYNPSCLDHIFINKLTTFTAPIFFTDISDHCGTALCIKTERQPQSNIISKLKFRLINDENLSIFETKLAQTNWDFVIDTQNVNEQYIAFKNHVNNMYKECFPLITKCVTNNRKKKPWITSSTMEKIKLKSTYYKLFKNGQISKEENNRLKNRLNKEIDRDKANYYQNLFSSSKNNMKKSWKTLRYLLGTQKKNNSTDKIFNEAKSDAEKYEIVNKFNDFFANIGNNLAALVPETSNSPTFASDHIPQSFFLFPPTREEISKIIMKLKLTWTPTDILPIKLLKTFCDILVIPITHMIDNSIRKGIFPDDLKMARITPIYKEGIITDPSNFRPISSLFYLSKVYEKFFANRLMKFCNKYSIISPQQFGFQHGISTTNALMSLTEDIYAALNDKEHFLATIIDVRKAFDCVDHEILLSKLSIYGVRGIPLNWLTSYLKDRKCYVELAQYKSRINTFNIGVPQGSILGPILFLLYVNNLPNFSAIMQTQLFADDTIVSNKNSQTETLIDSTNVELLKLNDWTYANKLTIHADKTKLLIVSNRIAAPQNLNIRILGKEIFPSNSCKYLGVFVDNRLTFKDHIKYINSKISRHTGILYKIRDNLPVKARVDYYYAYIYPYLSYNTLIWGGTYDTHLQPLVLQQKRTIRTITNSGFRDHTDPLFKRLKLLKVKDIYKLQLGIFMFHARARGEYPTQTNILTRASGTNRALSIPQRLTTAERSVSNAGPNFWNTLPPDIRCINSFKRFKKSLKEHFLSFYQSTVDS